MFILSREQIRNVDRRAIEEYGMPGVILMENAGRHAACEIHEFVTARGYQDPKGVPVCIVCGGGNNGGDGFVIARHLHNRHYPVCVLMACDADKLRGDAAIHHRIADRMHIPMFAATEENMEPMQRALVIVDALLGTGFQGSVRSPMDQLIRSMNANKEAIRVAVDVPSGMDCDTGQVENVAVCADLTITFVASKPGFVQSSAKMLTGEVRIVDIGVPRELIESQ